jgi:TPR repeat protein
MIHNLFINTLFSIGLVAASKARYPILDSDLRVLEQDKGYDNIVQISITDGGKKLLCSAVRVENFFLTAAHCLEQAVEIMVVQPAGLEKVIGYFRHPHYEHNPTADLAVVWTTLEISNGYNISTRSEIHQDLITVGFGTARDGYQGKQAFDVCGKIILDHESNVIGEEFDPEDPSAAGKKCGLLTPGDSGGALLQHNRDGSTELVGIAIRGEDNDQRWLKVDSLFINLTRRIGNSIDRDLYLESIQDYTAFALTIFPPIPNELLKNPIVLSFKAYDAARKKQFEEAIRLLEQHQETDYDAIGLCYVLLQYADHAGHRNFSPKEFQSCQLAADISGHKLSFEVRQKLATIQYKLYEMYNPFHGARAMIYMMASLSPGYVNELGSITKKYLKQAADNGNLAAVDLCIEKEQCSADEITALYNGPAKAGNSLAQYRLAMIYMPDDIVKVALESIPYYFLEAELRELVNTRDCSLSMKWLKAAADLGLPTAESTLGRVMLLQKDSCSTPDSSGLVLANENNIVSSEALLLLIKAANSEDGDAQKTLCTLFQATDKSFAYEYCLKSVPDYVLGDGSLENAQLLSTIVSDVRSGYYLPQGEALKKLTAILSRFQDALEYNKGFYIGYLGSDKVEMFSAPLPWLTQGPESQQPTGAQQIEPHEEL